MRPNELHATTCRELFREWLCSILVFKASPGDGARASVITSLSKPSAYVHESSCIAGTSSGTLVVAQGCNSCSILLLPTKISNSKGKAISCSDGTMAVRFVTVRVMTLRLCESDAKGASKSTSMATKAIQVSVFRSQDER